MDTALPFGQLSSILFGAPPSPVVSAPLQKSVDTEKPVMATNKKISITEPTLNPKKIPYITGFCGNGQHENSKLLSQGGALLPACRGRYEFRFCVVQCGCWCHEMFASVGIIQVHPLSEPIDTPDAAESPVSSDPTAPETTRSEPTANPSPTVPAQRGTYWSWLLLQEHLEPQLKRLVTKLIFDQESEFVESVENIKERRKRGSLEYNVEAVCRLWLEGKLPYKNLIPADIGMLINAMDSPSLGAIHAVFTRWAEQGIAEIAHSPLRFIAFTAVIDEMGIDKFRRHEQRRLARNEKGFF